MRHETEVVLLVTRTVEFGVVAAAIGIGGEIDGFGPVSSGVEHSIAAQPLTVLQDYTIFIASSSTEVEETSEKLSRD